MVDQLIPLMEDQCEVSQSSITYNSFDIYIDEEIKEPTYYRRALQVLRSSSEGDLIRIYISSPGGNMNSCAMLINAVRDCRAEVVAIIEAEAYSAAGLLALSCPSIQVKPYATLMAHSAAFGSGGIVQNVRDHVEFVGRNAEALMEEVYKEFLTPEEFQDLRRGRELWFDAQQIGERLEKMFEARQSQGCNDPNCLCHIEQGEEPEEDFIDLESLVSSLVDKKLSEKNKKSSKKAVDKEKPEA